MNSRSDIDKIWRKKHNDIRSLKDVRLHYTHLPSMLNEIGGHGPINDVELYKDADNYYLKLLIDSSQHKRLSDFFEENGYPRCRPRWRAGEYVTQIPNVKYLEDFLRVVEALHGDIRFIANEIVEAFKPHSKEEPTLPGWQKHTSNNQEAYYSCSKMQKTNFIALSYIDKFYSQLTIKIKKKFSEEFGFSIFNNQPRYLHYVIDSLETLTQTLQSISSRQPEIEAITDSLIDAYCSKNGINKAVSGPQYNINGERIDMLKPR